MRRKKVGKRRNVCDLDMGGDLELLRSGKRLDIMFASKNIYLQVAWKLLRNFLKLSYGNDKKL